MKATLIVVEGAKPARVPLQLPTTIGRSERAKLKLRASLVSRTHCELYQDGNELNIRDLGSSNGTKVNGERIAGPTKIVTDDMIQIGPVILRVICDRQDSIADAEPVQPTVAGESDAAPTKNESDDDASASGEKDDTQPEQQFQLEAPVSSTSNMAAEIVDAEVVEDPKALPHARANPIDDDAAGVAPDDDVITAEPAADEQGSSDPPVVVTYETNDEGSVIHIEEAADFLRDLKTEAPDAGESVLDDLHDIEPDRVDSGDSKLDNFFNNLD